MKKYPLPLEIVRGRYPIVTQEYGDKRNVAWYKTNGLNISEHNGTDIVISGGATNTYGTKLVCPVPNAVLNQVWFTEPMSSKGNGVKVMWYDERGTVQMVVWHCSECNHQNEYKERDTLGYIGNSGLTSPAPSRQKPFDGSHLHLGTYVNYELVDPRTVFDFDKWYVSDKDTPVEKDIPPLMWVLRYIQEVLYNFKKR